MHVNVNILKPSRASTESLSSTVSNSIGVLIVDSNQMQRQLLLRALRRRPEFRVAACSTEREEILRTVVSENMQVMVMNAEHARDGQGMALVRRLHLAHPEVAKILLLDAGDRNLVVNAFRSGARGLFCFPITPSGYCASVFRACIGERYGRIMSSCIICWKQSPRFPRCP